MSDTMYQYAFFATIRQGDMKAMQALPVTGIGPTEVPAPEIVNMLHEQLVKQAGLGAQRPTHYISVQIHELPAVEETKKPSVIVLPSQNGAK